MTILLVRAWLIGSKSERTQPHDIRLAPSKIDKVGIELKRLTVELVDGTLYGCMEVKFER